MQISDQRSPRMAKVEAVVFRARTYILLVLAALTVFFATQAAQLKMTAGFTKMLPQHDFVGTYLDYDCDSAKSVGWYQDEVAAGKRAGCQEPAGTFAGANRIVVVVENKHDDIYNMEFIKKLKEVTDAVFFVPGVYRPSVTSIWTPNTSFYQIDEQGVSLKDVIPGTRRGVEKDEAFLDLIRVNVRKANLAGSLVSTPCPAFPNDPERKDRPAGAVCAAMIVADLQDIDPTTRQKLDYLDVAHRLENEIRGKFASDKIDVKIIGFAKQMGDIADGATSVRWFFLGAFILTVLMLYLYCRSWILTGVTVSSSLCSLIWQFGVLHLMGYDLDPLAVLVPFLVFAIGVSHGVQQVNMAGAEIAAGKTKEQAARDTFTFLLVPGVVALSTCLAGFATLYLIPIPMIQELAVTASIGIGLKIVSNLIMLPLLVSFLAPSGEYARKVQQAMASRERFWPYVARIALPRNAFIMIGICIVLGIFGVSVSRGYVTGQGLQIGDVHPGAAELREKSRYNQDSKFIAENFSLGLNVLTAIVRVPPDSCVQYPVMSLLDRFQWHMANVRWERNVDGQIVSEGVLSAVGLPHRTKTTSVLYREGNLKWHGLPRATETISQSLGSIPLETRLLNDKCTILPLYIYTTDTKAETVKRVVAAVEDFRSRPENQLEGVSIQLATGNVGIIAATNHEVEHAELPMLLWVYGVIMTLVLLTYREWRGSLCCVLPLILSTIIGNMFLTLAGIGLKISTLPVLAIAVGIGVDYGIYEYNRIQRYMAAGRNAYEAYLQALNDVGSATMFTGFTLAIGVSTWSFSELKFQADMGLLLTFMFMINMIGAVTLLPALISALEVLFPRKNRPLVAEPVAPHRGH